jgi:hypothetical protein
MSMRVAAFGAFDINRPGERMHQVEIDGRQILRLGIEGQIGIECVAGLQDEELPRIDVRGGLDGVVIAIEAVRIIFAVLAGFANDDRWRQLDVAGVSRRRAPSSNQKHCGRRNFPNQSGFLPNKLVGHWMPSTYAARRVPFPSITRACNTRARSR